MISKSDIRSMTNSTSYNRGRDIYNEDKILDFSVQCIDWIDTIEARVKGSGRKSYDVKGTYNLDEDEVEDIHCECPAFYEYNGICKHCVAVLLEYLENKQWQIENCLEDDDEEEEFDDFDVQTILQELYEKGSFTTNQSASSNNPNALPAKKKPALMTTPAISQLLNKQIERRALPLIEQGISGQMKLEPTLSIDYGFNISLSFKLGVTQMYVLKDLVEFYNHLSQQAHYAYGQKLKFTHTLEAFREEDRPLVKFICQYAKAYARQLSRQGYYYNYRVQKNMQLDPEHLEQFIHLMGERPFLGNIGNMPENLWQVTKEKLPRELTIKGDKEGTWLQLKYFFGMVCSTQNIYFYQGKVYLSAMEENAPIQDFLQCMAQLPDRKAYIAKKEVPAFCRELLPVLEQFYVCHKENFNAEDYGIFPVSFEIYLDAPNKDWVSCKAEALYGEKRYNVLEQAKDAEFRDRVSEMVLEKLIMSYATSYDEKEGLAIISDEEKIYELLTEGTEKMSALGVVFVSDKLKRLTIKSSPKIAIGVSVEGDIMELSMISEGLNKEELVELLNKYKQKRKFYRLKDGSFIKVEGDEVGALAELSESLQLSPKQLKAETVQIPKYRALYIDSQLKEHSSLKATKNKAFKELIRNMKTVEDNDFEVPKDLEETLREYQKRGFLWLKTLRHNGFGGILADDMGLGKTLQVITFLLSERIEASEEKNLKTLIVCPASLVYNWKAEIERFAPSLTVKLIIGTTSERKALLDALESKDVVVTSYDLLRRDIESYEGISFAAQVIDEGQYIKNHSTQVAKAVKTIQAEYKVALTGTPIENRLSELWSIFDYLMPGFLYQYPRFKEELEQPITQAKDQTALERLQKMLHPFILRRLKKEVLTDLPDKLEENRYASLEGEQQKLYDANVQKLKLLINGQSDEDFKHSKIQILSELTRLRQICCDPALIYEDYKRPSAKMELCMELVQNAISGGHKILIFSQFTSMLEQIERRLKKEDISYYLLTGATSKEKRMKMVEQFNQDDTSVFCISLKAGGTGLNLTAADIVIHYDPWWNVAVQNQATDRAHRIGQENRVNVYKLIAKGTIEEKMIKIQELKKELADQILNGEGMNTGSFTKEELLELLEG